MEIAPLTELEAVNIILRNDGETPVDTLLDTGFSEVADALAMLRNISNEVQTDGWAFNTEYALRLIPDAITGHIPLSEDILWVRPSSYSYGLDIVERGRKLYNNVGNTYVFASPVYIDACRLLPFDELPAYARVYIAIRAARRYQKNSTGSSTQDQFTREDEVRAEAGCKKADQRTRRRGHFRSPKGRDSINRRPI